ncbi:MAG: mechanosensitive ion channel [Bacteroidetes bacterium]|nr:mechanosensitive ion channel [Bacteroidota bacterium]
MKHKRLIYLLISVLTLCTFVSAGAATDTTAGKTTPSGEEAGKHPKGSVVAPFGTPIFNVYTWVGPFSPQDRAKFIELKIKKIAGDPFYRNDSIRISNGENTCDVMYGEIVITSITDADAKAEGTTRELVANARRTKIIYAIHQYRTVTTVGAIIKNIGISIGILLALIIVITLINKLFRLLSRKAEGWQEKIMKGMRMRDYEFFNRQRQLAILLFILKFFKWVLILFLLIINLLYVFYLLPWTKSFSIAILGFVINPLKNMMLAFWRYIPNLITIIVILIVARLVIKLFKFLKSEVEKETLKLPGFYPDWALPTFNILRVLIIIFTIVAVWPYLPGSGSQVFQGVSVFFGLVFSLTSASALSNFMAGLTITYTRSFKLGDRVKIGEVTGDIIEKSMLVTKIKTIKNEEITVPNTKIMNSEVINYSTCAPDEGLILHTTVTIGYDAPWRRIHQLLIDAALNTDLIMKKPLPFVLQTALNDFYISYQLNAYTRNPNEMAVIFSQLHQNIQDSFNNAGVEIMSPHYKALRDGNAIAIPEEYRDKDYRAPSFGVENKD